MPSSASKISDADSTALLLAALKRRHSTASSLRPTIGAEHEFFVADNEGALASLEMTQLFLYELSRIPNWKVFSSSQSSTSKFLTRVSRESLDGKYIAVKYEYPPALLEVAFSYHSSITALHSEILATWEAIELAAHRARLKILSVPYVPRSSVDPTIAYKVSSSFKDISQSRRAYYLRRNEKVDESYVDFPAHLASTQIHIGGLHWWNKPTLLRNMYCLEPAVQPFSYLWSTQSSEEARDLSKLRWLHYAHVFKGMPLLGFPDLKDWSLSEWAGALGRTPLIGADDDPLTGLAINDLIKSSPYLDLDPILPRIRDLQILKPKLIGTLEFRADPALPDPEAIVILAGLRLAQCLAAIELPSDFSAEDFRRQRERWWNNTWHLPETRDGLAKQFAEAQRILEARGLGEERYLEVALV